MDSAELAVLEFGRVAIISKEAQGKPCILCSNISPACKRMEPSAQHGATGSHVTALPAKACMCVQRQMMMLSHGQLW